MIAPLVPPQVVCTLREFNDYRQYLATLRIEADKMYRREQVRKAQGSQARFPVQKVGASLVFSRQGRTRRSGEGCAGVPGLVARERRRGSVLS